MRRIVLLILAVFLIVLAGGALFALIENHSFWEGFYFAATTVTTVGYGDIVPHTTAGHALAVVLMLGGVGAALYAFSNLLAFVVEGRLHLIVGVQRIRRMISRMQGHYIVCGYGKLGRLVVNELQNAGAEFVIIERDPSRAADARERGHAIVIGDATEQETLTAAGIERASGVATTISDDAENVYIGITVRALRPGLPVVCRSSSARATEFFRRAGIQKTISTDEMGATRIADSLLRPQVVSFMDEITHQVPGRPSLHAVHLSENSPLAGRQLMESHLRDEYNVVVLAIRRGETYVPNPGAHEALNPGDLLILIGTPEAVSRLRTSAEDNRGRFAAKE